VQKKILLFVVSPTKRGMVGTLSRMLFYLSFSSTNQVGTVKSGRNFGVVGQGCFRSRLLSARVVIGQGCFRSRLLSAKVVIGQGCCSSLIAVGHRCRCCCSRCWREEKLWNSPFYPAKIRLRRFMSSREIFFFLFANPHCGRLKID